MAGTAVVVSLNKKKKIVIVLYWMVGFSERAIDNDGFPALDDFTLLVRSKKN